VGFLLLVGSLVACWNDDARPAPTATAAISQTQPAPPEGSPTPVPTATAPVEPAAPTLATVVPTDVQGLDTRTDSVQGDPYRYFATHPEIEAFPLLGETLNAAIAAERAAFEAARGPFDPVPPGAAGPSFNASFDFLVASGDVLGVHLLFYEFFGANGVERSATFWFDLAAGIALPPSGLFGGDDDLAAVAEALRTALLAEYGSLLFQDALADLLADPADNLDAIGFSPEGDLIVIFDEYSIGPGAIGRVTIALPADEIEPHLSDFGRRARAETVAPSGPLRLPQPAPPSPTPSAVAPPPSTVPDCGAVACVALTFDDGPAGPTLTLLDTLAEAHVSATFFVVGVNARLQPAVLARMIAEGHEIGNHSFDHKDLTTLSAEQISEQWRATSEIVRSATGVSPVLFRPPYGASNELVESTAEGPFILWSVDPRDWVDRDAAVVTRRVLESARPGDIILLHDIHVTSVNAVPAIIDGLRQRGFTFVTVSTLLGSDLNPGQIYRRQRD
jgi:peptidoglycan/xylan/chitin deacetylase (PgdA/CDA1 family)